MKTMLLPLSFLLLSSAMNMFPEAEASRKPVLDVKGFELLPGVPYYLISQQWPIGGGVVSLGESKNDTSCPADVVLREQFGAIGTPVTFSVAGSGLAIFITDYTDVFISFNTTSNCTDHEESMVWKHEKGSEGFTEILKIGAVEGEINTLFRIVKESPYGFTYKLVAYKLSSRSGLHLSVGDVGVSYDFNSGIRRLALTEPPLSFVLVPAGQGLKDM